MKKEYIPDPIQTETITLPEEIVELVELLAKNTHDIWAKQRLSDGWKFGPSRNDELKTHPDLKPYEELSDSEKIYDRQTALETIKAIMFLGYRITK